MALVSFRPSDPFDGLLDLQGELDQLLTHPNLGLNLGPSGAGAFPQLNIFRDQAGDLIVRAEVPGIKPDGLELSVEPRRLTLRGQRNQNERVGKGSYHRRERRLGEFSRIIQLPEDLDAAKASAEVRNGLLTVTIPRSEQAKPRQITIQRG
jgi:HSP20 family protein